MIDQAGHRASGYRRNLADCISTGAAVAEVESDFCDAINVKAACCRQLNLPSP